MPAPCLVVLGGSFDPVHQGHVALARYFLEQLAPAGLRIIPAGNPWQKKPLTASAEQRVRMLELAFGELASALNIGISIDQQEIERHTASYSIDTLRALRAELGPDTSIVFLIGADQLQKLHTWREWRQLFEHAHICAASRPGFVLDASHMDAEVAHEFTRRAGTPAQIRSQPHGLCFIGADLAVDISATEIRTNIRTVMHRSGQPNELLAPAVLDYIQQHHLYQS